MSWETSGSQNQTQIVTIQNGSERSFNFDGATPLKDVVSQVSSQMSYGSVLVKCDGRTVEPEEGEKNVGSFRRVEIVPKFSGA